MTVSLRKNDKVNLSKQAHNLSKITLGLGWDVVNQSKKKGLFGFMSSAPSIDCDASVFMLNANGKLASRSDIVYFGNLESKCGSVRHTGDNLTGEGDGDDEQIIVDLNRVPSHIEEILFVVNIYNANSKGQHFGMIENAFIRVVDNNTHRELARFDLTNSYSGKTAMIFGSLKKIGSEWEFLAIGEGTDDNSISELARRY